METAIEKMYDELKSYTETDPILLKPLADKVGCSVAHVSQTLKMAEYVKILDRSIEGDLFVSKFPKKRSTFVDLINDESRKYRAATKGTGRSRSGGRRQIPPSDFKIDEDTVIGVIQSIMAENVSLREKNAKLLKYAKKLRSGVNPKKKKKESDFDFEEMLD